MFSKIFGFQKNPLLNDRYKVRIRKNDIYFLNFIRIKLVQIIGLMQFIIL